MQMTKCSRAASGPAAGRFPFSATCDDADRLDRFEADKERSKLTRPLSSVNVRTDARQIADLAKENLGELSLTPDESNIFRWKAILPGPAGSPYEGGMFEVNINVPHDYP